MIQIESLRKMDTEKIKKLGFIERRIKNNLTLKRYRRFKQRKSSLFALFILIAVGFISATAPFWANSKPLLLYYDQKIYFPVLFSYHPSVFKKEESFVMDYRSLSLTQGKDWALWTIVPWDPYERNPHVDAYPSSPSQDNWLGTDSGGRDIFARILYGFRYSMLFALGVWLITLIIGSFLGGVMGYLGGRVDIIGQRILEVFESVPKLLLLITIISIFYPSLFILVILSSLFGWTFLCVYIRAEFLSLRKREFVEAARAVGASHSRIVGRHIFPNALTPLITFSPLIISGNIASLSLLDYLGLGLQPPTPSWGELLSQAQNYFTVAWWLALFPSLALVFTLLILNTIGSGIRDAFDSKTALK